jgi:phage terminase large subunit
MTFKPLLIYEPVFHTSARYIDLWGGRGRGGSYFASQYMVIMAVSSNYFRGYVARAIYSDCKDTIWKEVIDRIKEMELESRFNITQNLITCDNGNTIQPKGFQSGNSGRTANLKGFAGATHIVIDEAEEITEEQSNQLDDTFRTVKAKIQIIRVFNPPPKKHFIVTEFYDLMPVEEAEGFFHAIPKGRADHLSVFGTYLNNRQFINETTARNYERYRLKNPDYYYSQIKGYISGGVKGAIFGQVPNFDTYKPNGKIQWTKYSELPDYEFHKIIGIDFGGGGSLTDEPDGTSKTVVMKGYVHRGLQSIWWRLHCYRGHIEEYELIKILHDISDGEYIEILADNAQKTKIRTLENKGFAIIGAKTKDGQSYKITTGLDILREWRHYIHENDTPCHVELENYKWGYNKLTKEPTGKPDEKYKEIADTMRYPTTYYHSNYMF